MPMSECVVALRVWRRLGLFHLALGILDRWVRLVIPLRVLVVVAHRIDAVRPAAVKNPEGLTARMLTPQQARNLADEGSVWYSPAFASEALAMGDRCLGVFEGERLLSYCWYSRGPTPAFNDTVVTVDSRYMYSYKAFTADRERGRGLHAYGVAAAAAQLAAEGEIRGIVAFIEASNLSSLLSAQKIGDEVVGFVMLYRTGGEVRSLMTRGCATVGFRVHHATTSDRPGAALEPIA
ncbi:MAG TPA: hypothetical protein VFO58_08500 [Vicinamibacterales bacterium]|nr:hypothetical protein [Vicinamibacterales bacterium]